MARPRIEIPKKEFQNLCGLMCTLDEIAGFFECSNDTIERWCKREYKESFADVYKKYSVKGRISIRRYQMRLAEKNASMAIFLGKNYLGQKDCADIDFNPESLKKARELLGEVDSAID